MLYPHTAPGQPAVAPGSTARNARDADGAAVRSVQGQPGEPPRGAVPAALGRRAPRSTRDIRAYLAQLGEQTDLLRRQVLLILREPMNTAAAPTDGLGGPPMAVLSSLALSR
jgi:hypothetical protein